MRGPKPRCVSQYGNEWRPETAGYDIVHVPAAAGDAIIWDSRLPHANSPNRSGLPRLAQYVMYYPPGRACDEDRDTRLECFRSGRCLPVWRDTWPDHDQIEPWPPANLTPLGQRVLSALGAAT